MKIVLPLFNACFDDKRISQEIENDFIKKSQIYVWKDEYSWEVDGAELFSVWIEYGNDIQNTMMFEVKLDELEMFVSAIQKSIEMVRRDYADVIKEKRK